MDRRTKVVAYLHVTAAYETEVDSVPDPGSEEWEKLTDRLEVDATAYYLNEGRYGSGTISGLAVEVVDVAVEPAYAPPSPVLRRVVGALADALADVPGWKDEAMAILCDDTINPTVRFWDPDTERWVDVATRQTIAAENEPWESSRFYEAIYDTVRRSRQHEGGEHEPDHYAFVIATRPLNPEYQAVCGCGWSGLVQRSHAVAQDDAVDHEGGTHP